MFAPILVILVFNHHLIHSLDNFCHSNEPINRLFIIRSNIYFGQNTYLWVYNVKSRQVSRNQIPIQRIFGTNAFKSIVTAVLFDWKSCFKWESSNEFCGNSGEPKDIVLGFGETQNEMRKFGYIVFDLKDDNSLLKTMDQMSYVFQNNSIISDSFWLGLTEKWSKTGLTFDSSRRLLWVSVNHTNSRHIYSKFISTQTKLNGQPFERRLNAIAYGLFVFNDFIYALNDKNLILKYKWTGDQLKEVDKLDIKYLFNCFGNSSELMTKEMIISETTKQETTCDDSKISPFWMCLIIFFTLFIVTLGSETKFIRFD